MIIDAFEYERVSVPFAVLVFGRDNIVVTVEQYPFALCRCLRVALELGEDDWIMCRVLQRKRSRGGAK